MLNSDLSELNVNYEKLDQLYQNVSKLYGELSEKSVVNPITVVTGRKRRKTEEDS